MSPLLRKNHHDANATPVSGLFSGPSKKGEVDTPLSARVLDSNSNDSWDTARSVIAVGARSVYYCVCSMSWQTPHLTSLSGYRAPVLHRPFGYIHLQGPLFYSIVTLTPRSCFVMGMNMSWSYARSSSVVSWRRMCGMTRSANPARHKCNSHSARLLRNC
jgi:hypothetical protein